jgi:hypothetical protein
MVDARQAREAEVFRQTEVEHFDPTVVAQLDVRGLLIVVKIVPNDKGNPPSTLAIDRPASRLATVASTFVRPKLTAYSSDVGTVTGRACSVEILLPISAHVAATEPQQVSQQYPQNWFRFAVVGPHRSHPDERYALRGPAATPS